MRSHFEPEKWARFLTAFLRPETPFRLQFEAQFGVLARFSTLGNRCPNAVPDYHDEAKRLDSNAAGATAPPTKMSASRDRIADLSLVLLSPERFSPDP